MIKELSDGSRIYNYKPPITEHPQDLSGFKINGKGMLIKHAYPPDFKPSLGDKLQTPTQKAPKELIVK